MRVFMSCELEKELRDNLLLQANAEGRSRSDVIRDLATKYLETHQEWKKLRAIRDTMKGG